MIQIQTAILIKNLSIQQLIEMATALQMCKSQEDQISNIFEDVKDVNPDNISENIHVSDWIWMKKIWLNL